MSIPKPIIDLLKVLGVVAATASVAAGASALVVQRAMAKSRPSAPVSTLPNWRHYAAGGALIGRRDAPISIVEFSDFQCPYCAALHRELGQLAERRPGQFNIIYHHYPIAGIHPNARAAAIAASCAGAQDRFAPFASLLFDKQNIIGAVPWSALATEAGVPDSAKFDVCVQRLETQRIVDADVALGNELGIQGTPTLIVSGQLIRGLPDARMIEELLDQAAR